MNRFLRVFPLLLLAIPAGLAATGCNADPEMTRCVDSQDRVVADNFCSQPQRSIKVRGSLNAAPMYHRYYGGFGSYDPGTTAWGGSERALPGHFYETHTSRPEISAAQENSYQPYVVNPSR